MLKVEHITAGYGKKQVLTDVSFTVEKGDMVLLSGGNGSGKSTVLKCVYGLLKPWNETGKVIFEGEDITGLYASDMIRNGIVYMPQKKNVFEEFTVEENLWTSADIYSKSEAKARIKKVFELLPLLETKRRRMPFHMSGGEKQLLAFGNVLVHSPKLILLDEPFAGVDVENSDTFEECIKRLNETDITFLVVEHKKQFFDALKIREIKLALGTIKN
jgi:branched-chain amino acid transport system ATP-binding protein